MLEVNNPIIEVSILLSDDDELQRLNNTFRNKDKPTNVLSFPYHNLENTNWRTKLEKKKNVFLGDIAISYDMVNREAIAQGKPFQSHFAHMVVHGFLHLLGYDHIYDDQANEMEELETKILQKCFGIENPYINVM
jgi:probable rRNA maturation factor